MRIHTYEELTQAQDRISRLYRIVAEIRGDDASPFMKQLMLEGPVAEIEKLSTAISGYLKLEDVRFAAFPLSLRVDSATRPIHHYSTQLLTPLVDGVRRGVQAIAGFMESGAVPEKPTRRLSRACDLELALVGRGSLRVGLALPPLTDEPDLNLAVANAAQLFANASTWAANLDDQDGPLTGIESVHRDQALQAIALSEVIRIVPGARSDYDFVDLSGSLVRSVNTVRLTERVRDRIFQAIEAMPPNPPVEYTGIVRELDLDELRMKLRTEEGGTIPCRFHVGHVEEVMEAFQEQLPITISGERRIVRGKPERRVTVETVELEP